MTQWTTGTWSITALSSLLRSFLPPTAKLLIINIHYTYDDLHRSGVGFHLENKHAVSGICQKSKAQTHCRIGFVHTDLQNSFLLRNYQAHELYETFDFEIL